MRGGEKAGLGSGFVLLTPIPPLGYKKEAEKTAIIAGFLLSFFLLHQGEE